MAYLKLCLSEFHTIELCHFSVGIKFTRTECQSFGGEILKVRTRLETMLYVCRYGANKWRDPADPMEILYDWVNKEGIMEPEWTENNTKVTIGEETYSLEKFGKPMICSVQYIFL